MARFPSKPRLAMSVNSPKQTKACILCGSVIDGTRREHVVAHERILDLLPTLIGVVAPDLLQPTNKIIGAPSKAASRAVKT